MNRRIGQQSARGARAAPRDLSVVIPLFNEQDNIGPLHEELCEVLGALGLDYEIVFVDDGSTDATFARVRRVRAADPRVVGIRLRRNSGQTAAMQAGFHHAAGAIIVTMDGDLQNDPRDIPRLLDKLGQGYDLVCGWRKHRKDRLLHRKIPSWVANWILAVVTGVKIHDNGCSLKAYRTAVIRNMPLYADMHRFIPAVSSLAGARCTEIVVNHRARRHGASKYGISRVWKVLADLLVIKMLVGFATRPAHWFALLSVPFLVLAILSLGGAVTLYLRGGEGGASPLVLVSVTILFAFAWLHGVLLGLCGELVLRTEDARLEDSCSGLELGEG
jgi:glycosyltransferase involved in cell wall biosynthesis